LIDFIENSKKGFVQMLNEECMIPKGSDLSFFNKLKAVISSASTVTNSSGQTTLNPASLYFNVNPRMKEQFAVNHYAGRVTYHVSGFLDRNRDTIPDDLRNLMLGSSNSLIKALFAENSMFAGSHADIDEWLAKTDDADVRRVLLLSADATQLSVTPVKGSSAFQFPNAAKSPDLTSTSAGGSRRSSFMISETVTTKFKNQLNKLMVLIASTEVHYVRCIKPNTAKSSTEFNNLLVVEQLRSAGMIAAVSISRSAYPMRLPYKDFIARFRVLKPDFWHKELFASQDRRSIGDPRLRLKDHAKALLGGIIHYVYPQIVPLPDEATGDDLPPNRDLYQFGISKVFFAAGIVEKLEVFRQEALLELVVSMQTRVRGFVARSKFVKVKLAVVFIQPVVRGFLFRRIYKLVRRSCIIIQSLIRAFRDSRKVHLLRMNVRATQIQASYRMFRARRVFLNLNSQVKAQITIACCMRQYGSRRRLVAQRTAHQVKLAAIESENQRQQQLFLDSQRKTEEERRRREEEEQRRILEAEQQRHGEQEQRRADAGQLEDPQRLRQKEALSPAVVRVVATVVPNKGSVESMKGGSGASPSNKSRLNEVSPASATLRVSTPETEPQSKNPMGSGSAELSPHSSPGWLTSDVSSTGPLSARGATSVGATPLLSPRSSTISFSDNIQVNSLLSKISIMETALLQSREKEDRAREQSFVYSRLLEEKAEENKNLVQELADTKQKLEATKSKLDFTKDKLMAQIASSDEFTERMNELNRELGVLAVEKRSLQTELDNKSSDNMALRHALKQSQLRLTERLEESEANGTPNSGSGKSFMAGLFGSGSKKPTGPTTEKMVELEAELMTALTKVHLLEEELTREKQTNILLSQFRDDMVRSMGRNGNLL
jgi:myosin heavy subunit